METEKVCFKFYGTRGSLPICNPHFQEFGGDTTCLAIIDHRTKRISIIDAGSGIRQLGKDILNGAFGFKPQTITFAFTHFHWDHIQGFPFFVPAYIPGMKMRIMAMGKNQAIANLKEVFKMQMQTMYFPVELDRMGSEIEFIQVDQDEKQFDNSLVTVRKHQHPGGAFSIRFDYDEKAVVFCTDVEHGDELDPTVINLARDADLLIHDAQYTNEELKSHRGWGHSSFEQAMQVAREANCKQLVMTHHDPDHDDQFLATVEKKCQAIMPNCSLARTGMEIHV